MAEPLSDANLLGDIENLTETQLREVLNYLVLLNRDAVDRAMIYVKRPTTMAEGVTNEQEPVVMAQITPSGSNDDHEPPLSRTRSRSGDLEDKTDTIQFSGSNHSKSRAQDPMGFSNHSTRSHRGDDASVMPPAKPKFQLKRQRKKELVVLCTPTPSPIQQGMNQDKTMVICRSRKIKPFIVLVTDPSKTELVRQLLDLSGSNDNYPQFFLRHEGDYDFLGDFDKIESMERTGAFTNSILKLPKKPGSRDSVSSSSETVCTVDWRIGSLLSTSEHKVTLVPEHLATIPQLVDQYSEDNDDDDMFDSPESPPSQKPLLEAAKKAAAQRDAELKQKQVSEPFSVLLGLNQPTPDESSDDGSSKAAAQREAMERAAKREETSRSEQETPQDQPSAKEPEIEKPWTPMDTVTLTPVSQRVSGGDVTPPHRNTWREEIHLKPSTANTPKPKPDAVKGVVPMITPDPATTVEKATPEPQPPKPDPIFVKVEPMKPDPVPSAATAPTQAQPSWMSMYQEQEEEVASSAPSWVQNALKTISAEKPTWVQNAQQTKAAESATPARVPTVVLETQNVPQTKPAESAKPAWETPVPAPQPAPPPEPPILEARPSPKVQSFSPTAVLETPEPAPQAAPQPEPPVPEAGPRPEAQRLSPTAVFETPVPTPQPEPPVVEARLSLEAQSFSQTAVLETPNVTPQPESQPEPPILAARPRPAEAQSFSPTKIGVIGPILEESDSHDDDTDQPESKSTDQAMTVAEKFPGTGACYLVYHPVLGELNIHYSEIPIDGAVGLWTSPDIIAFKNAQGLSQSELIGNCAVNVTAERRNYCTGWCQFVKAAKSMDATVAVLDVGLPMDFYLYQDGTSVKVDGKFETEFVDAVACVPKNHEFDHTLRGKKWSKAAKKAGSVAVFNSLKEPVKDYREPNVSLLMSQALFEPPSPVREEPIETPPATPAHAPPIETTLTASVEKPPPISSPMKAASGPACYLVYETDSSGRLVLHYSKEPVASAIGMWVPGPGKTISGFKFTQNVGRSVLIGNCSAGVQGRHNYCSGWCQFVRGARLMNGQVTLWDPTAKGLFVDVHVYNNTTNAHEQTVELRRGEPTDVSTILAVACLPKNTQFFSNMAVDIVKWLGDGNTIGAASKF